MSPDVPPAQPPPTLLDRLRAAIRLKHFSARTEEAYAGWARRYIVFHRKRHPQEMGAAEVAAFLNHLATERAVSASTHVHPCAEPGSAGCPESGGQDSVDVEREKSTSR